MKVSIHDKAQLLDENALVDIEARMITGFARFGKDVLSVTTILDDINGPRGGVDKQCTVIVKLRKMPDVVVTVTENSLTLAINRALRRGERAMVRKVRRRLERKKRHQSWNPRLGLES